MDTIASPPNATVRRAVTMLGGPVATARTLNVKGHRHQTVQGWMRDGVPAKYCPLIERATGGAVRCEELRPDIEWGVLRGSAAQELQRAAVPQREVATNDS